jgi:hypothetical protein
MSKDASLRVILVVACIGLSALLLMPAGVRAKGCIDTLAGQSTQPPAALWGELQPVNVILNATNYNGNQLADSRYPQVTQVDIENGFLFASYWAGFGIWDLRQDPENPIATMRLLDGWQGSFPYWPLGSSSEIDQFIYTLDAPAGDDTLLAVGGISPLGLSIWDTSNKNAPVALYQDAIGKEISQVYAATIGGHAYAFAAGSFSGGEYGLFIYDMTAARTLRYNRCVEDVTNGVHTCPGVYVGKIGTGNDKTQYVHGMQLGAKTFLVISPGQSSSHFVKIYDVTDPHHPALLVNGFNGTGIANFTSGVALWQQASSSYLAVRLQNSLEVFDVTACLASGCAGFPAPIANLAVDPLVVSNNWKTVTFSFAGSTPMLFLGNHDLCHTGDTYKHSEYIFDMSNPAQPRDITPAATTTYQGETVDYWSYYYPDTVKGFGFTAPRAGKFYTAPNGNSYLYRADLTLFDIHRWTGTGSPVASFNWAPTVVYAGDPVTFSNLSTGPFTSLTWSFQDGSSLSGSAGIWWPQAAPSKKPPQQ